MSDIKSKYKFVSRENEKWASIMLTEGKFKDVIFNYGKVSVPNEDEKDANGNLSFQFEYNILDNVGIDRNKFGNDFFTLIGDILVDIINEQTENYNYDSEDINANN